MIKHFAFFLFLLDNPYEKLNILFSSNSIQKHYLLISTADSPVKHTVRLTIADREVRIPVFLFGSECRKLKRWIRCEHSTKGVLGISNS